MTTSPTQVATSVLAALNAELAPHKALLLDAAKGVTKPHVQVQVARMFTPANRAGRDSLSGFRVVTVPVANSVANASELERGCEVALNGAHLAIDGKTSTPVHREANEPLTEDEDHFYTGYTTWTFAL